MFLSWDIGMCLVCCERVLTQSMLILILTRQKTVVLTFLSWNDGPGAKLINTAFQITPHVYSQWSSWTDDAIYLPLALVTKGTRNVLFGFTFNIFLFH